MTSNRFLVICSGEYSFGHMLAAYIKFYSFGKLHPVVISTGNDYLHPLAVQVMKEDGINLSEIPFTAATEVEKRPYAMVLTTIPAEKIPEEWQSNITHNLRDTLPFDQSSYEQVLDTYRINREVIRKFSIDLVGNYNRVAV